MDYMFSNNINLVYINISSMFNNNIKSMNNILLNNKENMVFCFDSMNFSKFKEQTDKIACPAINCSSNWLKSRRNITEKIRECVNGECASIQKFFYDYVCYDKCPLGTYPYKYICSSKDNYINDDTVCDVRQHFLRLECQSDLIDNEKIRKFIEDTMKNLINGELYDFKMMASIDKDIYTIRTENATLQIYALSNKIRDDNLTYVVFDECVNVLKKKYNLSPKDDIIIFKVEYYSPNYKIPIIEYTLINAFKAIKLNLEYCRDIKIKYNIPKIIDDFDDYKYNPLNEYYQDECFPYSINNIDIILYDRKKEFNENNMSLCERNCEFIGYKDNRIECYCKVKTKFNSFLNENSDKYNLIYRFDNSLSDFPFSLWVTKCFFTSFTKENIYSNICGFIIMGILFINIVGIFLFRFIEYKSILKEIFEILELPKNNPNITEGSKNINQKKILIKRKSENVNNNIKKFFKNPSTKLNNSSFSNSENDSKSKINLFVNNLKSLRRKTVGLKSNAILSNVLNNEKIKKEYIIETDNEMNFLEYNDALSYDRRNFCQYYISLIRTHQLLAFTFNTKKDYNSFIIKICFFSFMSGLILILNILFIDDSILHHIYINKGKYDILLVLSKIIYVTIISYFFKIILIKAVSIENIFLIIKKRKNQINNTLVGNLGIKFVVFFGLIIIILLMFWIYVVCFFGVFPKIQMFVLIIYGISFGLFLILPFIVNIIPPIFRIYSLSSSTRKYAYKLSQLIQYV